MRSKINETTLLYNKICNIIGGRFQCTCGASKGVICTCDGACFCTSLQHVVCVAVSGIVLKDSVDEAISFYKELEYAGATMLDCAEFIQKVREKEEELYLLLQTSK